MRSFSIFIFFFLLSSCYAPVIKSEYIETAIKDVSIDELKNNPEQFKEKTFILAGMIVNIKNTDRGSIIEAIYTPADSRGYIIDKDNLDGRFLAVTDRFLDPFIYKNTRFITIVASFEKTEKGSIGEIEYIYPLFRIKDIHLWKKEESYHAPCWWYDPWYYPWRYDPWWYPR